MTSFDRAMHRFCPMFAHVDASGHIRSCGATLDKLNGNAPIIGARFLEIFEVYRPRAIDSMAALLGTAGTKLHLRLRMAPRTALKGVLMPDDSGGAFINLSFGISVVDAVRDFNLSSRDFAPTDLAIEMLYLVEAKSAAMEASRTLNKRLQVAKIAAEEQAFTDTLTGLKNRRALDHILARNIAMGQSFALMHLDLDYFKAVNDTLGHAAGDHVLQEVAAMMLSETRKNDTIARVGGDEFVLVFEGLTTRDRLTDIARRLIQRLEVPIPFGQDICSISGSIGITVSTDYAEPDAVRMIEDADIALYASKRAGRAQHCFFEADMHL